MRVAIIVKNLKMGGMQRASINLSEIFTNNGHEAHLIYFQGKGKVFSPDKKVQLHLFDLEKILKLSVIGLIFKLLANILNIFIKDSLLIIRGAIFSLIFKVKLYFLEKEIGKFDLIIIRGHGTIEMIWLFNSKNLVVQKVNFLNENSCFNQKIVFSNKNVMTNSNIILQDLKKSFSKYSIKTKSLNMIPSPIDIKMIETKANEYIPEINDKFIISLGRLSKVKNISLLIDAYYYARNNFNLTHKLVIIGDGKLRKSLENQVLKLKIKDHVIFTGTLMNPYPWLKKADLLLFTSLHEGLPNVLLESLACKTPIISTSGEGGTLDIMTGELEHYLTSFRIEEIAKKTIDVLLTKHKINFTECLKPYTISSVIYEYNKLYLSK